MKGAPGRRAFWACALFLVSCGGDSGPADPTPSAVTVIVSPPTFTLSVGETRTLTKTVTGAANSNVTWESSASSIATVVGAGVVAGVAPGTAVILARSTEDPSKTGTSTVTVIAAMPDLVVESIVTPVTGSAGGTLAVSFTVRNRGLAPTTAFVVGL